jgi:hypothetical protein
MNFAGVCKECQRLSEEYEAATMDWFRAQGQLRVAEFSREEECTNRIAAELNAIALRREALREAVQKHDLQTHTPVTVTSGEYI